MTVSYARTEITELDILRAEHAANDATASAVIHERQCRTRARGLDCLACGQHERDEFSLHTTWESLVLERARQQGAYR